MQATNPGDELRDHYQPGARHVVHNHGRLGATDTKPASTILPSIHPDGLPIPTESQTTQLLHEPRRFHMSRLSDPPTPAEGVKSRKRVAKGSAAVFVERRVPTGGSNPRTREIISGQSKPVLSSKPSVPDTQVPARNRTTAPLRNATLASGEVMPWNASHERLNAEMQAYSLEEIGRNIAESEASSGSVQVQPRQVLPRSPSKFKPKAPALRYHERHPEAATATENQDGVKDLPMPDTADEIMDDADYIIDTYVRIPAEIASQHETQKNFGLLVLDSQPDIDEFYNEDSDDDSEIYDEEEDENGLWLIDLSMHIS